MTYGLMKSNEKKHYRRYYNVLQVTNMQILKRKALKGRFTFKYAY